MANFSPGWNSSPASEDYMERDSARGAISAQAELRPELKKSHVIQKKFQPGLKSRK